MTSNWPGTSYPLPDVYFSPAGHQWQVSICLQTGSNTFRWLYVEINDSYILALLNDWRRDPVAALAAYWHHEPPVQEARLAVPKTKALSLSDLTGIKI